MISKYQTLGAALTPHEMKEIKGGFALQPPKTRWWCLIEPTWYHHVCYSVEPSTICGYSQPCTPDGTCTGMDLCVS